MKKLIEEYMNSSQVFAEDIKQLSQKLSANQLKGDKKQSIVVFSHELDIISIMNSNNSISNKTFTQNSITIIFLSLFQTI